MKTKTLEHLRSPVSGRSLQLADVVKDNTSGEIISGRLIVDGESFDIAGGVPILMSVASMGAGQVKTWESFSDKWQRAPEYREATLRHYQNWYLERYGFETVEKLQKFLAGKKMVLDSGTGHGRDAQMYAENSSATIIGMDFSYGIRNAYRDLGQLPNLHLVQADMMAPPFEEAYFDFVACDQALHHTPNTHSAFQALLKVLKPGGHIATYVYKKKAPIREFTDDFIRGFTTQMEPDECMKVSEAITALGKALSDLNIEFEVPQDIDILGIKAGTHNLQRFIYYNIMKCYWNDDCDWDSNVITNFDWYHPYHAFRHTAEEVRSWCEEANLVIERLYECPSGISLIARKPEERT